MNGHSNVEVVGEFVVDLIVAPMLLSSRQTCAIRPAPSDLLKDFPEKSYGKGDKRPILGNIDFLCSLSKLKRRLFELSVP
ncbi:hypothetical protein O181_004528 [Austropuccinia psidii MF-1]|uniref:Uncharacterized protein n=1 Tax=Austropuccinia psidii MF-1 TaxID=1389203 RepID=A0A9Q3GEM4_9BASI|nr:hypothetical protein [Austropuccinia psidii MF-1]